MTEIIIAALGSITTILSALITGWFGKNENKDKEDMLSDERKSILSNRRRIMVWRIMAVVAFLIGILLIPAIYFARTQNEIATTNAGLNELIKKKLDHPNDQPYILPNILMNVILDSVGVGTDRHIEADIAIVYNAVYIRPLNLNERAFNDFYEAHRGETLIKLGSSDKDITTEGRDNTSLYFNFLYDAKQGDNRFVVSHIKAIYPRVLPKNNSDLFGGMDQNELAFLYPNKDKDIIGNLIIMVSSSTLKFEDKRQSIAVVSLNDNKDNKNVKPGRLPDVSNSNFHGKTFSTVVARFDSVKENDLAGLKVTW